VAGCAVVRKFAHLSVHLSQSFSGFVGDAKRAVQIKEIRGTLCGQLRPASFFFVFLIGTHVDLGQNYSSVGGEALKMKNASMREISGNILKREISLEIPECFDS